MYDQKIPKNQPLSCFCCCCCGLTFFGLFAGLEALPDVCLEDADAALDAVDFTAAALV